MPWASETYGVENRGPFVCTTHLCDGWALVPRTRYLSTHLFLLVECFEVSTCGTFFSYLRALNRMSLMSRRVTAYLGQDFSLMDLCLGLAFLSQRGRECIWVRAGDDLCVFIGLKSCHHQTARVTDKTYKRRALRDGIVRK